MKGDTFLATMDPVCGAGATDLNKAPECIAVTCQPVINANRMKGALSKETNADMSGVAAQTK